MNAHTPLAVSLLLALAPFSPGDDNPSPDNPASRHQKNSEKLASDQDELTANVKQMILEQTAPPVIKLLDQVKDAMNDSSDGLSAHDTGGVTIAAETDVIEKMLDAAKERQKQQGGQSGGAMLDMMERMAGKSKEGQKPGEQKGGKPGDQPGQGQTGDSNMANESVGGQLGGKDETRRVPKAAGTSGQPLPPEFRQALDAYNRGAEKLAK
jgi:hypothetical protein